MVISCSALGCRKRQNSLDDNGNKVSFHRFPRNKDLCQAWLAASKREDFVPTKFSYLCSEHFTDDQYTHIKNTKRSRLKANAVPSVFKGFTGLRKKTTKQDVPKEEIEPKLIYENPNLVKIAPKPQFLVTDTTSSSIYSALNSLQQPTSPIKQNSSNVSIYMVHPQPNGSSIVTMPSSNFGSLSSLNLGDNSSANISTNSIVNLGAISNTNLGAIPMSDFGAIVPKSEVMSDNAESASLDGDLSSDEKRKAKIKTYQDRIKSYRWEIKLLHQKNRRQQKRIDSLQKTIKELQSSYCTEEEEDFSEDMSEEEIYAELLKHQSESDSEDMEDC